MVSAFKKSSRSGVKIGGNHNIVNAASAGHGPSWRMVVKLNEQGVEAWGTYPGSQTGNPGNPMYTGLIEEWAQGKYTKLIFEEEANFPQREIIKKVTFSASE